MPYPIDHVNPELFWSMVDHGDELFSCWVWGGRIDTHGYGEHRERLTELRDEGIWRAHRVAYELQVGPIPDGLVIDHLCRVRSCVNPAHLEPVTIFENTRRGLPGSHLPESVLPTVVTLYQEGWSSSAIGTQFGVHRETILRALKRLGVPIRSRGRNDPNPATCGTIRQGVAR